MAEQHMNQSCVQHLITEREILDRLKSLEEDMKELSSMLKTKADSEDLESLVIKSAREIEGLKKDLSCIGETRLEHSAILASIPVMMNSLKESQDLLRADVSKLTECYMQVSVHIASITAVLTERLRAEKDKDDQKAQEQITAAVKESKSTTVITSDPWYIRLISKNNIFAGIAIAVALTLIILLFTRFSEIAQVLQSIFSK